MNCQLQISNLSKSFGELAVLNNLNLSVNQGELVTVLGASGGGKTTLLRLIAGFDTVDAGSISVGGQEISTPTFTETPDKRSIGIVPQDAALFPHLNVGDNVGFGLSQLSKVERAERIREMLDLVELTDEADRMPHQLSGGQQQRVALARALATRPALVLLDEPFAALDHQLRGYLRDEVRASLLKAGATALLVTHDQNEALSIADRVAILRDGEIAQIGTPREIYNSPTDVALAQFLGEAVVLPATISEGKAQTVVGSLQLAHEAANGLSGSVVIRPEAFYLQPDLNGSATVIGRQFFGHDAMVSVKVDKHVVYARTAGPLSPELGMKVSVWVRGAVNFFPAA